jgi:hypothetical protein
VSGVAHYELANAITADLKKQLDKAVTQAGKDPFGFGFPWNTWNTWDTTSHGAGLVVMASEYDQLTGTNAYAAYEDQWTGNILGANGWGLSFIVGDGAAVPDCLQHQVANLAGSLTDTSSQFNSSTAEFRDNMQSYSNTEPAIDLTAADAVSEAGADESYVVGDDHGLDPVAGADLGEGAADVGLDGGLGKAQVKGDLAIGEARGDGAEDLEFALSKGS